MNLRADEFLSVFANERRLEIISILLNGEISVGALATRLGLTQSALSQHLARMRAAGVVTTRRDRQTIFYSSNFQPARRLLTLLKEVGAVNGGSALPFLREGDATTPQRAWS